MYKNIVVAVDGSDNALRAVEQAAMLAQLSPDAKVEVISVIAIDVYSDMVYDPIEAHGDAQRELVAPAMEILEKAGTVVLPMRSSARRKRTTRISWSWAAAA